jgi:phosphoglycolate phosphatase
VLLIFDWDGTLSDSTGNITSAMQQAAGGLGLPVPEVEQIHNIIGLGLPEAIERLFPTVNERTKELVAETYRTHFLVLDQQSPSELFPGVLSALECLHGQGHLLAIATGKSRRGLNRILNNLNVGNLFHATRCADETASKPHPLMLEQLLIEFDCSAIQAVMVGDTEYDMEMARCIGMPRIAVSYGAHARERLEPYLPNLCLDHFEQILAWPGLRKS